MRIFVSIASYRDPQLLPTIADCLASASDPAALRFGICWQHGPGETGPDRTDARFRVLDVDWRKSRGTCWARAEIMRLWSGEELFLQLDSHHRFAPGWDRMLIEQLERTGSARPILSAYLQPFDPAQPGIRNPAPLQLNFDRFTDVEGVRFRAGDIPGWQTRTGPVRARFLSGHFVFTVGQFVNDVPYDPDLYFCGEEITLAIRAFTHGYDAFHPIASAVWHEYIRRDGRRHWHDHVRGAGVDRPWHDRDAASRNRVTRFLREPWIGPLGCGTVRSFADYEAYAGLNFRHRKAQDYTRLGHEPPNPPAASDWVDAVRPRRVQIRVAKSTLPVAAERDPLFWYVGFHDRHDREIFRQDASEDEVRGLLAGASDSFLIEREFQSGEAPASWTVWPVSRSEGWLPKMRGIVESEC